MGKIAAAIALLTFASFAQTAPSRAGGGETRTRDQWRGEYRKILAERVDTARASLEYSRQRQQLGAATDTEVYEAESMAVATERAVAAFDGGLIAELPRQSLAAASTDARDRYRTLTKRAVDIAEQEYRRLVEQRGLGMNNVREILEAQLRWMDLRLELAAFEAGLELPPIRSTAQR